MRAHVWAVEKRVFLESGRRKWRFEADFEKRKHAIQEIKNLVDNRGHEKKNLRVAKYVRIETP